jgi:hypothetical protein
LGQFLGVNRVVLVGILGNQGVAPRFADHQLVGTLSMASRSNGIAVSPRHRLLSRPLVVTTAISVSTRCVSKPI